MRSRNQILSSVIFKEHRRPYQFYICWGFWRLLASFRKKVFYYLIFLRWSRTKNDWRRCRRLLPEFLLLVTLTLSREREKNIGDWPREREKRKVWVCVCEWVRERARKTDEQPGKGTPGDLKSGLCKQKVDTEENDKDRQ